MFSPIAHTYTRANIGVSAPPREFAKKKESARTRYCCFSARECVYI